MYYVVSSNGAGEYLAQRLSSGVCTKFPQEGGVNIHVGVPGSFPFKMVNSTPASDNYMLSAKVRESLSGVLGLTKEPPVVGIYSFFNGAEFAPWLEVQGQTGFMNLNVGPKLIPTVAVGYPANGMPGEAIRNLDTIKAVLGEMEYKGEVMLPISKGFEVCQIILGHNPSYCAMYGEIIKGGIERAFEFCLGGSPVELYQSIVAGCLVSLHPFPGSLAPQEKKILAPASAEKHLWRWSIGGARPVWITTHGLSLNQARARIHQTITNIAKMEPDLQYRTDLGYRATLLFSPEILDASKPAVAPGSRGDSGRTELEQSEAGQAQ